MAKPVPLGHRERKADGDSAAILDQQEILVQLGRREREGRWAYEVSDCRYFLLKTTVLSQLFYCYVGVSLSCAFVLKETI